MNFSDMFLQISRNLRSQNFIRLFLDTKDVLNIMMGNENRVMIVLNIMKGDQDRVVQLEEN